MDEDHGPLLDPDLLRRLIRQLESTDVDEVEVTHGGSRLYLRREPGQRTVFVGASFSSSEAHVPDGAPVIAPLTGVLYTRPSPAEQPFVSVGELVEPGQVVALIETMKLFNEVTVDVAGEVVSMVKQEGELVEAGQALMYVALREESEEA